MSKNTVKAICGNCGSIIDDPASGLCINGHDHWVEAIDFDHPGLKEWLEECADNLDITLDKLREIVGGRVKIEYHDFDVEIVITDPNDKNNVIRYKSQVVATDVNQAYDIAFDNAIESVDIEIVMLDQEDK